MSTSPPQGYVRQATLHRYKAKAKRDQCLRDKLRAEADEQRMKIAQLEQKLAAEKEDRNYWHDKCREAEDALTALHDEAEVRNTARERITARLDLIRAEIEELTQ
jgi:chromosome segregation ATPase